MGPIHSCAIELYNNNQKNKKKLSRNVQTITLTLNPNPNPQFYEVKLYYDINFRLIRIVPVNYILAHDS